MTKHNENPELTPTPQESELEHKCEIEGCTEPKIIGEKYCTEHYMELIENQKQKYGEEI